MSEELPLPLPGEHIAARGLEPALEGRSRAGEADEVCRNCGARLAGPYCGQCGQRASELEVPLREVLGEALSGAFSLDSRMVRTVRPLLLRPGFLTLEYWHGRRARYTPPLKLYLFVSFLCFLLLALAGDSNIRLTATSGGLQEAETARTVEVTAEGATGDVDLDEAADESGPVMAWFVREVLQPIAENPQVAQKAVLQRVPWAIFLLVPFFAAVLRVLFRHCMVYFVGHLIFCLHLFSAGFLLVAVGAIGDLIAGHDKISDLGGLGALIYFYFAARRVYGLGRFATSWRLVLALAVQAVALVVALMASVVVTALTL